MFNQRAKFLLPLLIVTVVIFGYLLFNFYYKEKPNREIPMSPDTSSTKIYIFLMDTGDPDILNHFLEKGALPNFAKLKARSVYSRIQAFVMGQPPLIISLPIIGSIFTSKTPEEHGMTSHIFLKGGPELYYPFKDLKVKPLWKILSESGKAMGILGTNGNYPVETDINGFIVSAEYVIKKIMYNYLSFYQRLFYEAKFPDDKLLYPRGIKGEIDTNLLKEDEIQNKFKEYHFSYDFPANIEEPVLKAFEHNLDGEEGKTALRLAVEFIKSDKTAYLAFKEDGLKMALANHFYPKYRPDFFLEYLQGMDFYTIMYNNLENMSLSDSDNSLLNYYKFYDAHLGEIMDEMGENTILMVLSDHGAAKTGLIKNFKMTNIHGDRGIFFISGKNIIKNKTIGTISVYDVTPTILYLMGLPVGKDMRGKVITDAIEKKYLDNNKIDYIDTYK